MGLINPKVIDNIVLSILKKSRERTVTGAYKHNQKRIGQSWIETFGDYNPEIRSKLTVDPVKYEKTVGMKYDPDVKLGVQKRDRKAGWIKGQGRNPLDEDDDLALVKEVFERLRFEPGGEIPISTKLIAEAFEENVPKIIRPYTGGSLRDSRIKLKGPTYEVARFPAAAGGGKGGSTQSIRRSKTILGFKQSETGDPISKYISKELGILTSRYQTGGARGKEHIKLGHVPEDFLEKGFSHVSMKDFLGGMKDQPFKGAKPWWQEFADRYFAKPIRRDKFGGAIEYSSKGVNPKEFVRDMASKRIVSQKLGDKYKWKFFEAMDPEGFAKYKATGKLPGYFNTHYGFNISHKFPRDYLKRMISGRGILRDPDWTRIRAGDPKALEREGIASLPGTGKISLRGVDTEYADILPGFVNHELRDIERILYSAVDKKGYAALKDPDIKNLISSLELWGHEVILPNGMKVGKKLNFNSYEEMAEYYLDLARKRPWRIRERSPFGRAQGGIVNGYAGGGLIKKLLGESLGMMSRRKFMKGMGATAVSAALPKSAMKLAAPAAKKAALSFAPPWVNGMLSALKSAPLHTAGVDFARLGNNASVSKIGSNKIKLYGGKTGTESHFRVKSSDQTMADDMVPTSSKDDYWDDIVLREEPGETTITWKNKMYDHGNDQHIVIDKINKETRFVDDNWHMEAGGEDIAKDDWIEWSISPKAIEKNMLNAPTKAELKINNEWLQNEKRIGSGNVYDYHSVEGMDNTYSDMFKSYVDSFSPSGNVFGTVGKMREFLNRPMPSKTRKMIDDFQKHHEGLRKEKEMLDWEEQFRGGHGMHGYYRGGTSMRDYPQSQRDTIVPKRKPMDRNRLMDAIKTVESGGEADQGRAFSRKGAMGPYQIMPGTAREPGYGVSSWPTFAQEYRRQGPDFEQKSRDWARSYVDAMFDKFQNPEQAISAYFWGPGNVMRGGNNPHYDKYNLDYYNAVMDAYNSFDRGGMAEKFSVEDAVAMINANPQSYAGGGIVKKFAPKVLGKLTQYATRARPTAKVPPLKKPWAVFDKHGAQIKEFRSKNEANSWFKKAKDEAPSNEYYEEVLNYKVDKIPWPTTAPKKGTKYGDPDKPGAIFWGSREKIIGSPQENMTGQKWLDYLLTGQHGIVNPGKFPIIKHAELNDTSLAPFLSKYKNKVISKKVLVDSFDRIAPKMDVKVAGREIKTEMMNKYLNALKEVDPQSFREPQAGIFRYLKSTEDQLKRGMQLDAVAKHKAEAESILQNVNKLVYDNYGIANVLEEGFPQKFPFEFKNMINQLSSASGKRVTGLRSYSGEPQYTGTQTLGGGENPRELLFKYTPGSMRKGEPVYNYQHEFSGIPDAQRKNAFVHTRLTDRTDAYGRRILFIEEIQSDMHQPIRQAQKYVKGMAEEGKPPMPGELAKSRYAQRGDVPLPVSASDKVNEDQFQLIVAKIDDLGAQPQTVATQKRIAKLNRERKKIRKIIDASKKKVAKDTSGVPQGPYSKTEDYNEFVIKYATKMAQEGGYDGVAIASPAIKNKGLRVTDDSYGGNLVAYGPIARAAMKKVSKKSGAKFVNTSIMDENGVAWEVPMIWLDDQAKFTVSKGLPAYKRGGIAKHG